MAQHLNSTQDENTEILVKNNEELATQGAIRPDLLRRARNLLETIIIVAQTGGELLASREIQQTRLSVCQACDRFWLPEDGKGSAQCRECGCFIHVKTAVRAADCPLKRWPST